MPTFVENTELFDNYLNTPLTASDDDLPTVKFVSQILNTAIEQRVSDIHFEPYEQEFRIRFRIDGLLTEINKPPLCSATRISSHLKVLANLDIAERRKPQDGRFQLNYPPLKNVDIRISTCPTIHGEKIVLRILDTHTTQLQIDSLGLDDIQKDHILFNLSKPQGLFLVTGPTGSGKTITLYSALNYLNSKEKNISTAEDPVEIKIDGINQVNMNPKAGVNFCNILRSFLRQDPDIIMIGEIRDLETAELAIKAAHTGHLVLSTLHTNSAAETLIRLSSLGIPAFNIASALSLLVAQRLVRRLCNHCKTLRDDLSPETMLKLGFCKHDANHLKTYKAKGCEHCSKGYHGRMGLFEVMPISTLMKELIQSRATAAEIVNLAQSEGVLSIHQSGLEKVKQGLTSLEELGRVTVA